jgi:hypothetical protein
MLAYRAAGMPAWHKGVDLPKFPVHSGESSIAVSAQIEADIRIENLGLPLGCENFGRGSPSR